MVAKAIQNARSLIAEGHAYMQNGERDKARFSFDRAAASEEAEQDPLLQAEALQMRGVVERLTGYLTSSAKSLQKAKVLGASYPSFALNGRIMRDLGATYQALCWKHSRAHDSYSSLAASDAYNEAINCFDASIRIFEHLAELASGTRDELVLRAELEATRGFKGAAMCEYGRNVRQGALLVCGAQLELRHLRHPVYAFNNTIRAMLFGPLSWRLGYALEAIALIRNNASSGSVWRVVAALFGNRIYRLRFK